MSGNNGLLFASVNEDPVSVIRKLRLQARAAGETGNFVQPFINGKFHVDLLKFFVSEIEYVVVRIEENANIVSLDIPEDLPTIGLTIEFYEIGNPLVQFAYLWQYEMTDETHKFFEILQERIKRTNVRVFVHKPLHKTTNRS